MRPAVAVLPSPTPAAGAAPADWHRPGEAELALTRAAEPRDRGFEAPLDPATRFGGGEVAFEGRQAVAAGWSHPLEQTVRAPWRTLSLARGDLVFEGGRPHTEGGRPRQGLHLTPRRRTGDGTPSPVD